MSAKQERTAFYQSLEFVTARAAEPGSMAYGVAKNGPEASGAIFAPVVVTEPGRGVYDAARAEPYEEIRVIGMFRLSKSAWRLFLDALKAGEFAEIDPLAMEEAGLPLQASSGPSTQ